jgi:uncharacterized membrane protein YdjX (TVP38/TMEM64 family)
VFRLLAVALAVAGVAVLLKLTGALDHLSFAGLARNREWLAEQVDELGFGAPIAFIFIYAVCTALSLPTGLALSTLAASCSEPGGAGCATSSERRSGQRRYSSQPRLSLVICCARRAGPFSQKLEAGFRENELSYMLVLRLVPLFPFWLVNLAPAFLGVRLSTFVIGTAVGIIPGAFVFASVGMGPGRDPGHGRSTGWLGPGPAPHPRSSAWPCGPCSDPSRDEAPEPSFPAPDEKLL